MKIVLVSFILIVASTRASSQDDMKEYLLWKNTSLANDERMDALNIVIQGIVFTDPDSAISLANQQLAYAKKIKSEKNMSEAHNNLGIAFAITGRNAEAIIELEESVRLLKKRNATAELAVLYSNLGEVYRQKGDLVSAVERLKLSLECFEKLDEKEDYANTLTNLGNVYVDQGDIKRGLETHFESLAISVTENNKYGMARSYGNIALIYDEQGQYALSIEWYLKGLALDEEQKNRQGMAKNYNNLAVVYKNQHDFAKSHEFHSKALKIRTEIGDISGQAETKTNLAILHEEQGEYAKAEPLYLEAIQLYKESDSDHDVAAVLANLGGMYLTLNKLEKALSVLNEALELIQELGMPDEEATVQLQLARYYSAVNNRKQAIFYGKEALKTGESIGFLSIIKDAALVMYSLYKAEGNQSEALKMHELYALMKDSILNTEAIRSVVAQSMSYEFRKQQLADSIQKASEMELVEAEVIARDAQLAKEETTRFALFGGLGLLLIFIGIVFQRFRVSRVQNKLIAKQKVEVEMQRDLAREEHEEAERQKLIAQQEHRLAEERKLIVEEKNKEILDSIQYAKRLQDAILPPVKLVKSYFDESFVLYRPKDIVSGDFYWMETTDDLVLFAVADCTGHGVPGALVSVVCANALNKAVKEYELTDPGKILNATRSIVIETLTRSGSEVRDGMDISLCVLNEGARMLSWAGANNPLWVVRAQGDSVEERKADKQPIGLYGDASPFITHHIELQHGDMIYLFSDGYADQFGGNQGKKLKSATFKELIVKNRALPMEIQRELLEKAFDEWKGPLEQIDDVCVIGMRLNGSAENPFSAREMEIIQLLAKGQSSKAAADTLHLSSHTIDTHRRRILKKANASNTPELLDFCRKLGVIS